MGQKKKAVILCRCNEVSRETVEAAIRAGAHTLNEIFDATSAGVGSCGGSCRRKLAPLLRGYLETGSFPEKIVEDARLTGEAEPPPTCNPTKTDPSDDQ